MKSEPDRLDFLIVLLPVILVGLLGFQTYEYIQMNRQRAGAVPVSSQEPPDAASTPEAGSPEAAPEEGESAPAEPGESGDGATAPDAQPGDAGADGAAAQGTDAVAEDPATTDSPGEEAAPDGGKPGEAGAQQTPDAGEPAAADADQPATGASPPTDADADPGAGTPVAGTPPVLEEPGAAVAAPRGAAPAPGQPGLPPEAVPAGGAEVLLQLNTNPAKVGEVITAEVLIQGASEAAGAIFHLRYDQTLLQLNEDPQSEMGPFFQDAEGGARFNARGLPNGRVVVSINVARDAEGRSGDGRLATFYFQVLAPGEARLDLLQSTLRDARNRPLPAVFTNAKLVIVE